MDYLGEYMVASRKYDENTLENQIYMAAKGSGVDVDEAEKAMHYISDTGCISTYNAWDNHDLSFVDEFDLTPQEFHDLVITWGRLYDMATK